MIGFETGERVRCVNDKRTREDDGSPWSIVAGEIYTIRAIEIAIDTGTPALVFEDFSDMIMVVGGFIERGYAPARFRKLPSIDQGMKILLAPFETKKPKVLEPTP